jgi:hypothetical protein
MAERRCDMLTKIGQLTMTHPGCADSVSVSLYSLEDLMKTICDYLILGDEATNVEVEAFGQVCTVFLPPMPRMYFSPVIRSDVTVETPGPELGGELR